MALSKDIDPALHGAFEIFCNESRSFFTSARALLKNGDTPQSELRNGFHKIKGGAGFFGLDELRLAAGAAEKFTLSQQSIELDALANVLIELHDLFEESCKSIGVANE